MKVSEAVLEQIRGAAKIAWNQLDKLMKEADGDHGKLCKLLIQKGHIQRDALGDIVAGSFERTYVPLDRTLFQPDVVGRLPRDQAEKYTCIPIYKFGSAITVAMDSPHDAGTVLVLEKLLGCAVDPVYSFADEIASAIKVQYESAEQLSCLVHGVKLEALVEKNDEELAQLKPVVAISESLISMALKERASDIHIEPKANHSVVRFRIDGCLVPRLKLPRLFVKSLVARYKIMADLDLAELRKPQDGRISFSTPAKSIDVRISTLPVLHGEKIVMRLLGSLNGEVSLDLEKLSIAPDVLEVLKGLLDEPNGIIFVTGPTGSGKSTTLYAALKHIDVPDTNITTIEDPVEYEVSTLNQSPVHARAGRTFQSILRAILRQDPDVVLVGEIRDTETARIAAQAALTGHLVLSSLHTNSALQAITRLIDMGVEPFVVAPALIGVVGQRLVRRLCSACKRPYKPDPQELGKLFFWEDGMDLPTVFRGEGCPSCHGTGYRGRIGIHEVFRITKEIRERIVGGMSYEDIRSFVYQSGFKDMRFDGFRKAFQGLTTLEEVVRATSSVR